MEHIDVNNQQLLVQALEGSLSAEDNRRKKCEEYLINFSLKEGSVPALMRVMSNFQFEDNVRLAASIRLKNHILSHWVENESEFGKSGTTEKPVIVESDRAFLLDNLYLCLVSAGPSKRNIRNQCFEILRHVMFHVEIKDVKNLLSALSTDLSQRTDSDRILCALSCLRKVASKYEYHGSTQAGELNGILTAYFGPLLAVAQDASKIGLANDEAATLIHLVLKIYFSLAMLTSPTIGILRETLPHWMSLVKYVITEFTNWQQNWPGRSELELTPFSELGNENEEHLCNMEQFKCMKWTLRILMRFMSRQNSFTDDPNKQQFFTMYTSNNHSNDNLLFVLKMLKMESEYQLVLNNMLHYQIWAYLRHCLGTESHFHFLIKGNLTEIVGVYCMNTFKYTKEDLNQYEEDPETFIQSMSDVCFQFYSSRGSCSDFLRELVKSYTEDSLVEIKKVLNVGFETKDSATLHSVLSLVGYVADKLIRKNKPGAGSNAYGSDLNSIINNKQGKNKKNKTSYEHLQIDGEELLEVKVAGLLNSEDIWIRMRSAWLCGCVLKRVHEFRKFETLRGIYVRLLELLGDNELVVAVLAANSIIELFRMENVQLQEIIVKSISVLLERLFMLMNRIELESVTSVLGEIVDNYSHEVVPYAKEIIINITNNITKGLLNKNNTSYKEYDGDEKMLVRWSMLQTLNTIISLLSPNSELHREYTKDKPAKVTEDKLVLEINSYAFIITTIVNLLKLLFNSHDEDCFDYLDEASLLLANLVKLLDIASIKQLMVSSGCGFANFWQLFVELLNLVKYQDFELVSDFSIVRDPLVALAYRDSQGFANMLDDFYRLCIEASNKGFVDEVDDVLADCLEVTLNSGAMNKAFEPLLTEASNRVVAVANSHKKTNIQDLAADNMQLIRLTNLLVLYYYKNLNTNAAFNQSVLSKLKLITHFIVKYSVYCNWRSIRKYCILTCCTLVNNNVTKIDDVSVLNVLVTLMHNAKNDKTDSEDDYQYSSSDSEYEDEYSDDDDDSEWDEFEFEESPLKGVCEMKLAKQVIMGVNESLSLHQINEQQLMELLNSI